MFTRQVSSSLEQAGWGRQDGVAALAPCPEAMPVDAPAASCPAANTPAVTAAPAATAGVWPFSLRHTWQQQWYRLHITPMQVAATPTPIWRASACSSVIGAPVVASTWTTFFLVRARGGYSQCKTKITVPVSKQKIRYRYQNKKYGTGIKTNNTVPVLKQKNTVPVLEQKIRNRY
jgi:hypothetical protein